MLLAFLIFAVLLSNWKDSFDHFLKITTSSRRGLENT